MSAAPTEPGPWRVRVAAAADLRAVVHGRRVAVPAGLYTLLETDGIDLLLRDDLGDEYLVAPADLRPLVADERIIYLSDIDDG
jgi:hypothetical protein